MPGPGELVDQVVEALAGLGALEVAKLRAGSDHEVVEISIGIRPMSSVRMLVSADVAQPAAPEVVDHDGEGRRWMQAVLAERERLARDLHDDVVQEVFATAMALAALVSTLPVGVRTRIEELIDKQDEIVRRLRSTVFALKGCGAGGRSALDAVERVVSEAQRALGFEPTMRVLGDLSALDGDEVVDHLVMALRESLSNVARHAEASRVEAEIAVSPSAVRLVVVDDGRGLGAAAANGRSRRVAGNGNRAGDGLHNLDERARMLGGRCTVSDGADRGTVVDWSVPLRTHSASSDADVDGQGSGEASSDSTSSSLT